MNDKSDPSFEWNCAYKMLNAFRFIDEWTSNRTFDMRIFENPLLYSAKESAMPYFLFRD